jgi:hypothetical protein
MDELGVFEDERDYRGEVTNEDNRGSFDGASAPRELDTLRMTD